MNGEGMPVVLVRGVNFGFWPHIGSSGQNADIFSMTVLFRVAWLFP